MELESVFASGGRNVDWFGDLFLLNEQSRELLKLELDKWKWIEVVGKEEGWKRLGLLVGISLGKLLLDEGLEELREVKLKQVMFKLCMKGNLVEFINKVFEGLG